MSTVSGIGASTATSTGVSSSSTTSTTSSVGGFVDQLRRQLGGSARREHRATLTHLVIDELRVDAEDAERHKGDQSGKDDRNGQCNLQVVANPIKGVFESCRHRSHRS